MTMTLSGSGTITGITAGGLPDGVVQPADLTTGAPSWDSSGNLSFNSGYGSAATAYGCRAWVNFDGTGTYSPNPSTSKIRASGNVSSILKNGTGDYTVNFTNAMPDANYSVVGGGGAGATYSVVVPNGGTKTISATNVYTTASSSFTLGDASTVCIAVFR